MQTWILPNWNVAKSKKPERRAPTKFEQATCLAENEKFFCKKIYSLLYKTIKSMFGTEN